MDFLDDIGVSKLSAKLFYQQSYSFKMKNAKHKINERNTKILLFGHDCMACDFKLW